MNFKVKDILNGKMFEGFQIIAGEKGIHREISTVSVMDAPDIYNWLKGGEFLITTGYVFKNDPSKFEELVVKIEKSGAAALGIKLLRFIEELPPQVIETANRLKFPIIYIPIKYSFVDIINPVLSHIVNIQSKKLMYSEKIHKSFTELVINGGDIKKILNTLSHIINKEIIFYCTYFHNIYTSNDENHKYTEENLDIKDLLLEYWYYTIKIDKKIYGYLFVKNYAANNEFNDYTDIALEHASTVLKLQIQKQILTIQIETKYRDEFVRDLIMENIKSVEEVNNRAALYGWKFQKGNIVLIADIDNFKINYLNIIDKYNNETLEDIKENIFSLVKNIIRKYFNNAVYTSLSDSIIFILQIDLYELAKKKEEIKKICEIIRRKIYEKTKFTLTIGIGSHKNTVLDISKSYDEARKSIQLGRNLYKRDYTVFYDELGVFKILASIAQDNSSKTFLNDNIGKLIEYDIENKSELLHTLKKLIKNNWSLKNTAEELFIHYNTMKYRYNKIADILGMDLNIFESRVNLSIALKLKQLIE